MIALLVGCSFGTVEQGRAVGLDPATHQVTVVVEPSGEARTYVLPDEPAARGPEPVPGGLLDVDAGKDGVTLTVFDGGSVRRIVLADGRIEPLDAAAAKAPPRVDAGKVTLPWPEDHALVVGTLPDSDAALPLDVIRRGDLVRLYVKAAPAIARFMNVSRTDIYKK